MTNFDRMAGMVGKTCLRVTGQSDGQFIRKAPEETLNNITAEVSRDVTLILDGINVIADTVSLLVEEVGTVKAGDQVVTGKGTFRLTKQVENDGITTVWTGK